MISRIRNSQYFQFLWIFMGMYLLNLSVDMADANPAHIPEDLTINDQESIIELVVETFLGYENAIEEFDDPDAEDHNQKSLTQLDLISESFKDLSSGSSPELLKEPNFPEYEEFITMGFSNLFTPPPQV